MKRHCAAGLVLLFIGGYLHLTSSTTNGDISPSSNHRQQHHHHHHVLAVVGPANYEHVVRLVTPSQRRQQLTWSAFPLDVASSSSGAAFDSLCDRITGTEGNVSALLALTRDAPTTFVVVTVASLLGLPVLGYLSGYGSNNMFHDINPYFVDFSASTDDLVNSIVILLEMNKWYNIIAVTDASIVSTNFVRSMRRTSNDTKIHVSVVKMSSTSQIRTRLPDLPSLPSRIVILHCDIREICAHVLLEAQRFNLLSNQWIWIVVGDRTVNHIQSQYANVTQFEGLLALRSRSHVKTRQILRSLLKVFASVLQRVNSSFETDVNNGTDYDDVTCFSGTYSNSRKKFLELMHREMKEEIKSRQNSSYLIPSLSPVFEILNFVHSRYGRNRKRTRMLKWRFVGNVSVASGAFLNGITWAGAGPLVNVKTGPKGVARSASRLRVVTAFAPPLVVQSTFWSETSTCIRGVSCVQLSSKNRKEIAEILADFESSQKHRGISYNVTCCSGLAIELLVKISSDLNVAFTLYIVADGEFGVRRTNNTWSGLTGDLVSGAAHMAVSAFSVTQSRQKVIDFSVPFFETDISCLAIKQYKGVPLAAFLVPFSTDLWVTIFASLNLAALAAAAYEWLSPFGLNPWGRQRTKNFSLASALWVMWSLLFSHLVAFKAPKSWPNKVLINLWGCFSVIFLASYTANIAALFAGLSFQTKINHVHDSFLMSQKVGTLRGSSTEIYILKENPRLFYRLQRYSVANTEEGIQKLYSGEMDILIGDSASFDYIRGWSAECNLDILGQALYHDSYAIGMQPGFPMKDAISSLLVRYSEIGHIDDLKVKWYGDMPCFKHGAHIVTPTALSPNKVAGVFIVLVTGFLVAFKILAFEHIVFKYFLPGLRKKAKNSFWKSPNLMFFSQKLYRFINCVELVSPHHSAKEIASNLRAGQIFSLFQKSVKRKAKEDARRRKSKSLFFDMIQEVTRRTKQNELCDAKEPKDDSRRKSSSSRRSFHKDQEAEIELLSQERPAAQNADHPANKITITTAQFHFRDDFKADDDDVLKPIKMPRPISASLNDIAIDESKPFTSRILSDSEIAPDFFGYFKPNSEDKKTRNENNLELIYGQLPIDDVKLEVMSKKQIMALWLESEFELRKRLEQVTKEKQVLESKLLYLQSFIRKPP